MTLRKEDKNALVTYRLQRANETMAEVKGTMQLGYWRITANRFMPVIMPHVHCLLKTTLQHIPIPVFLISWGCILLQME